MYKSINQISEQAFLIDFGDKVSKEINNNVIDYFKYINSKIKKNNKLKIKNCVPSYNKLLIQFDPININKNKIYDYISSININKKSKKNLLNIKKIPICYDEEFALDINNISKIKNLSKDQIINEHLNTKFYVYMLGFMPGFPFMGDLSSKLYLPRLENPRVKVPALSVGIIEKFCGIYPYESPGGWNIIGRIPNKLFFKNKKNLTFLEPGMDVKFFEITKEKFNALNKKND
tara:strand:- start:12 stop:707 length:696 start_codon:yes stop_codon:yes gene_type:complete